MVHFKLASTFFLIVPALPLIAARLEKRANVTQAANDLQTLSDFTADLGAAVKSVSGPGSATVDQVDAVGRSIVQLTNAIGAVTPDFQALGLLDDADGITIQCPKCLLAHAAIDALNGLSAIKPSLDLVNLGDEGGTEAIAQVLVELMEITTTFEKVYLASVPADQQKLATLIEQFVNVPFNNTLAVYGV